MKEWQEQFDTTADETCMDKWVFHLTADDAGRVTVRSVEITPSKNGCKGHPKTITALVRNLPLSLISPEALAETGCPRKLSCGMVLGRCQEQIRRNCS